MVTTVGADSMAAARGFTGGAGMDITADTMVSARAEEASRHFAEAHRRHAAVAGSVASAEDAEAAGSMAVVAPTVAASTVVVAAGNF